MSPDRKLKRGLADLSKFFSPEEYPAKKRESKAITTEPFKSEGIFSDYRSPHLICTSFVGSNETFEMIDQIKLIENIKTAFQETYLLSVESTQIRYKTLMAKWPVPIQGKENEAIHLHVAGHGINFGYISSEKFQQIIQPKAISNPFSDHCISKKDSLVVFDSINFDSFHSTQNHAFEILELLDHAIFVTQPNFNQLLYTYKMIRFCLARNPALRCSMILVGRDSQMLWEFVYERFNEIVSKFLDCDLVFLGWIENSVIRLNSELLLEESGSTLQLSSKTNLSETLRSQILSA